MQLIDQGEQAGAILGLAAFLAREPQRVLASDREAMQRLPRTIRTELRAFLDEEPRRPKYYAAGIDYLEVLRNIGKESDPQHAEQVIRDFGGDHDLATAYIVQCGKAIAYLRSIATARATQTMTGEQLLRPGDIEAASFLRRYAIADKPLRILDSMRDGCLVPFEVEALLAVFPSLRDAIVAALTELITDRVTRTASYTPGYRRNNVIGTLLQIDLLHPDLAAAIVQTLSSGNGKPPVKKISETRELEKGGGLSPPSEASGKALRGT